MFVVQRARVEVGAQCVRVLIVGCVFGARVDIRTDEVAIRVVGRVERSAAVIGALVAWGLGVALTVVPALLA